MKPDPSQNGDELRKRIEEVQHEAEENRIWRERVTFAIKAIGWFVGFLTATSVIVAVLWRFANLVAGDIP